MKDWTSRGHRIAGLPCGPRHPAAQHPGRIGACDALRAAARPGPMSVLRADHLREVWDSIGRGTRA